MPVTMVYVSCAEPREILSFQIDPESGMLRHIGATYVPGIDQPSNISMPLAVSPDRGVLHAGLRRPPYPCVSFAIGSRDGALRVLGSANLPQEPCYLAVDRTGRHLLTASYQGALIASHALDARGVITAPPIQIVETPPAAHSVIQDSGGRFVYAASLGGDVIMRFRLDSETGRLDDVRTASMPEGAGPRHLRLSPSGRFLYVLCERDATIGVFAVASDTGLLDRKQICARCRRDSTPGRLICT